MHCWTMDSPQPRAAGKPEALSPRKNGSVKCASSLGAHPGRCPPTRTNDFTIFLGNAYRDGPAVAGVADARCANTLPTARRRHSRSVRITMSCSGCSRNNLRVLALQVDHFLDHLDQRHGLQRGLSGQPLGTQIAQHVPPPARRFPPCPCSACAHGLMSLRPRVPPARPSRTSCGRWASPARGQSAE